MPAINLTDYQTGLSRVLLDPELPTVESIAWPMHLPCVDEKQQLAISSQRLGIYRNNVMHSLTEAMAAQFPIVKKLVGNDFFLALARDFVRTKPPREPALTFYGEDFPDFIAGYAHCRPLPYLPDVARLEWTCQVVLHAADESTLQPGELTTIDSELLGDVTLHVKQAVALLSSSYPVVEIRHENLKDEPGQVDLSSTPPSNALITRKDHQVTVTNSAPSVIHFMQELRSGQSIGASWEAVAKEFSLNDEALPPLLGSLLGLGVFSGFAIQDEE